MSTLVPVTGRREPESRIWFEEGRVASAGAYVEV